LREWRDEVAVVAGGAQTKAAQPKLHVSRLKTSAHPILANYTIDAHESSFSEATVTPATVIDFAETCRR
jgi:hypothetical protein